MRHDPFLPDTRVPVERFQRSAYRHAVELDVAGSGTETISLMSLRSHRSVAGMFIGCFILLLFLLGRLAQLQITQGNTYRVRSAGNSF